MDYILENWENWIAIVGGIVLVARIIVKLTPTPKDDAWFAKIIAILKHLGLYIPMVLAFFIVSCGSVGMDGVQGNIFVIDPSTGAKAGLSRTGTVTSVYGRQYDSEGNLLGGGEVIIVDQRSGK